MNSRVGHQALALTKTTRPLTLLRARARAIERDRYLTVAYQQSITENA